MIDEREKKEKTSHKAGKIAGFGTSLFVFVSVMYAILSFLDKIPFQIQYIHVVSFAFMLYIFGLIVWGKRWV